MKQVPRILLVFLLAVGPRALGHGDGGGDGRPSPDGGERKAFGDTPPPKPARRPRLPDVCIHRNLMDLSRTMHNVGEEDDEAIRKAAAGLELGVDRLKASMSGSVSRGWVLHDEALSQIHVTFRGFSSIEDWVTDFIAIPRPAPLLKGDRNRTETSAIFHAGFYEAAKEYKPLIREIRSLVDQAKIRGKRRPRLHISGHSLGGALSVIFAYFLAEAGIAPDEVTLFGTPRVDLGSFAATYWSYPGMRTTHYVVDGDPVPDLPPGAGKLPASYYNLYPKTAPGSGDGADFKKLVRNHHPDYYVDGLTEKCEEQRGFRERRLYDSFVAKQKRPPTETELQFWAGFLYTQDFAWIEKNIAENEVTFRKGVKDLFWFLLNRRPTEEEYLRYTPYLAQYPLKSDSFHDLEAAIKATDEYKEWHRKQSGGP